MEEIAKPLSFFGSPFWHINDTLPKGALEWALKYKKTHPMTNRRSNRGGYQSTAIDDYSEFEYFGYIKSILNFLPRFEFQTWWINVNERGNFNMAHTHPGSDLSLVWFLTDINNSFRIQHPLHHTRCRLSSAYKGYNRYGFNYNLVESIDARAGDIIMFPSDLEHYVEPHEHRNKRVTVSFNLKLKPPH